MGLTLIYFLQTDAAVLIFGTGNQVFAVQQLLPFRRQQSGLGRPRITHDHIWGCSLQT